jgi:hypothetical protein
MFEMAYMHNIIPTGVYESWRDSKCAFYFRDVFPAEWDEPCSYAVEELFNNMEKINFYDVYRSPSLDL